MLYVKIGKNCKIFPGAVIGAIPQDMKYSGEVTWVEIGNNTVIRECATVNRGTAASGKMLTKIGDNCLIMSYAHVAHDCRIGNHVIQVSYVGLAGETDVDDWAIIGGGSLAHQFTRIGMHAMIQGGSKIAKDVPPYALVGRSPLSFCGLNNVGLRRRGFTNEQIDRIREIYRIIYNSGLNRSDAWPPREESSSTQISQPMTSGGYAVVTTAYFPPVEYFMAAAATGELKVEDSESYVKQSYRNRCRIYACDGVLSLTVPVCPCIRCGWRQGDKGYADRLFQAVASAA